MRRYATLNRCTVQRRNGDFCDADSAEGMPFPICGHHAAKLYRAVRDKMHLLTESPPANRAHALDQMVREKRSQDLRRQRLPADYHAAVVYYVRVGELVKIGTTEQLKVRMRSYPPGSKLLAKEQGGHELETTRHHQFRHLLAHGNEWFRADQELLDFAAGVKAGQRLR